MNAVNPYQPQPYQPQPQPYGAPHVPAYVVRADRNGMGVAGLVLGIVGLSLSVVPIVGIVAWFVWPVGLALAGVGLHRCESGIATNRGAALAGLVTSMVAAAVCVGWLALTVAAGMSGH